MSVVLKEEKREADGFEGKNSLGVIPHSVDPKVLCFQIREKIDWNSTKNGSTQVVWLTAHQVRILADHLKMFLDSTVETWTDAYGVTRTAGQMETSHLWNVMGYLRDNGRRDDRFYAVARAELVKRGEI